MSGQHTYLRLLLVLLLASMSTFCCAQEEKVNPRLILGPGPIILDPDSTNEEVNPRLILGPGPVILDPDSTNEEVNPRLLLGPGPVILDPDSIHEETDSIGITDGIFSEPIKADSLMGDSVKLVKPRRDWTTWKPNPKRAMWLALVFPGAGQIYNRKYWKLPIFYGGFVGCAYAWAWNNQMYSDYKQAYLDIMDDDDSTHSYDQFMHLGNTINDSNLSRYQSLFSKRKDRYRRYRDLSFFCIIAVYILSVIDAYVDASLSEFDISEDLSMHVEPAYINSNVYKNPLKGGGVGVQCSLNF